MKTFILDTNVLIHDPDCLYKFEDNKIIIPFIVLEELDKLKKKNNEVGVSARKVIRTLEELSQKNHGSSLTTGVKINDSILKVVKIENPNILNNSDDIIILTAERELSNDPNTILISKDLNVRIKARIRGIHAEDYLSDKISIEDIEKKSKKVIMIEDLSLFEKLYKQGYLLKSEINARGLFENLPIILKSTINSQSALVLFKSDKYILINSDKFKKHNIHPMSTDQIFALEMLFSPNIVGMALFGGAGSGKTYITLSAALAQMPHKYRKIVITKPVVPVGRDIGYNPGTYIEKMSPWLASYMDNLEQIFDKDTIDKDNDSNLDSDNWKYLIESGIIEIQPITYIRGRNFVDSFVIIDEAHNLSVHEIKTILTRIGSNSKVVILGDLDQIDTPYLDKYSNGLIHAIDKLRGIPEFGYVKLNKVIRSSFVEKVVKRL